MAPLFLTIALLLAQLGTLVSMFRRGLWHAVPAWACYVTVATVHLMMGLAMSFGFRGDYPTAILYLEPFIIFGQIAFTFEASIRYLHKPGGSPERRMLLWLIPLVPAAITLPIEVGFVKDALLDWNSDESESLKILYSVRFLLALTMLLVLCIEPLVARLANKSPSKAAIFHHRVLMGYLASSAAGYWAKLHLRQYDMPTTVAFFLLGPLFAFATWSWVMWDRVPRDMEAVEGMPMAVSDSKSMSTSPGK